MGTLFVNKSGRAFKITRTNGGSDVIGTLPFLHGQIPGLETALEPIIRGFIATVCMVGLMELLVPEHLHL